jgi:tRNA A37 threonylcarbamoyladenosine synthetase subunit TsaC/SUA5/YrdC
LVVHNHDEVTPWLTGGTPGAPIGLRLPSGTLALPPVAATSANLPGEPTITRVDQLPDEVTKHVACAVDVGPIASAGASTVLDLTQWESGDGDVVILRDAAGRAGSAIAALECAPER